MPLGSQSLQTPVTDLGVTGILDGQVTAMAVVNPNEDYAETSLLKVSNEFHVKLSWQLSGAATAVVGGT
jgi:hypothetical protein